jgi:plasmid stability protein
MHCIQNDVMAVQLTIRDVPERVRDELALRAAAEGKSMQEFLRAELARLAAKPSLGRWLEEVRGRKRVSSVRLTSSDILAARDADRR